ncbi:hypothetical protein CALVIDRAFT_565950 [Calocera viscosa TUFC12733]|uniref:Uncharacterized protein n=1 Tax=Calocera viscosa (strain TUFC12733) TaxID=1330018 RepID=A0A167JW52_CALVF|nr:hypothetical protein CALVIDRAFT_565950 [Calocera viscosa TUFC12733]
MAGSFTGSYPTPKMDNTRQAHHMHQEGPELPQDHSGLDIHSCPEAVEPAPPMDAAANASTDTPAKAHAPTDADIPANANGDVMPDEHKAKHKVKKLPQLHLFGWLPPVQCLSMTWSMEI